MASENLENNIKDWLPSDFPETKDLEWFGEHFVGERFVLVTWPGCNQTDQHYNLFIRKLENELELSEEQIAQLTPEELESEKVRQLCDRLGLCPTGNYHEDWGGLGEKWLQGNEGQWYFIKPNGELWKWDGDANVGDFAIRSYKKKVGQEIATGELVTVVGESLPDVPNRYHADPRKLTARFFKTVRTGPQMLDELTFENGPLWPRTTDVADEDKPLVARQTAYKRLTGTLFGPAIHTGFSWDKRDFKEALPETTLNALPADWEDKFEFFVDRIVKNQYGGDHNKLVNASSDQQTEHWDDLFVKLRVDPPPRQTCLIVTMSKAGKRDLARVIGRPILGKPPGRLLALGNEAGILPHLYDKSIPVDTRIANLKMGGPPVDNVAIDEEGTITLVRLVGYSALVGISLSLICFRSIRVTIMVFFVGGVAAIASLAIVFWSGSIPSMAHLSSVDAVLMSMPALVYVLGLSGAVHIVNYYREAVEEGGIDGAAERAIGHAWGPCTLAAFTTALGLISLFSSNLMPIKKFGLFSALGVMATLSLLFCYLPAALTIWPFLPKKREVGDEEGGVAKLIERMWLAVGRWIIGNHWLVTAGCIAVMVAVGLGLNKIKTDVQLLKLFDSGAKIIGDYNWLENNLGELVPMELVVKIKPEMVRPAMDDLIALQEKDPEAYKESAFQLNAVERIQLVDRIQKVCEQEFGEAGQDKIGKGMSAATFIADLPGIKDSSARGAFNRQIERQLSELPSDYVRTDTRDELWRISERLGALNDVDYGIFVNEQKVAVEPILTAYRFHNQIVRQVVAARDGGKIARSKIVFLGSPNPTLPVELNESDAVAVDENGDPKHEINQTAIFSSTINDLMLEVGCQPPFWHDPTTKPLSELADSDEKWAKMLESVDSVVLVGDHPDYDVEFIRDHSKVFFDARDHVFELGKSETAAERGESIQVVYTGVVPVVYKAQRTLLNSLVESIGLAFVMIAAVMMVLLRDWRRRLSPMNSLNVAAGMTSMVPNVFPVVVIFGAMGHLGVRVDIGTMMCASVAMGVAVDDTIHFLTWFRIGLREGMDRRGAILEAYRRVGTAMTQTTLIGGLGLAVFAMSTFTPTQRFGVMMVTLLVAALVGDLILLPALLAGPLGRFFMVKQLPEASEKKTGSEVAIIMDDAVKQAAALNAVLDEGGETKHSKTRRRGSTVVRSDDEHRWPRH